MLVDAVSCLFHICFIKASNVEKKVNERKVDRLVCKFIINQPVWELEPETETKSK